MRIYFVCINWSGETHPPLHIPWGQYEYLPQVAVERKKEVEAQDELSEFPAISWHVLSMRDDGDLGDDGISALRPECSFQSCPLQSLQ